jgi:3-hydroxyisobutyrate dehydrogenase-like beta-hydroxyacid dehydrogenase
MRVAFLGLGGMGMAMAANIAKAGHDVIVWNRTRKSPDGFDAKVAGSIAEAVGEAEVAATMLADDHAVESVVKDGLLDALAPDAVHVSMSTIGIATARRLTASHQARDRAYVAAPVFGRPDMAAPQKLWVATAGPAAAVEKVRPVLQAVGRGITEYGEEPWHANLVKLGNNMMLGAMLETFGEVYALMRKAGIEPQRFLEAANSLFQSPVYANYGGMAAERRHEPALFKAPLGLKDMRLGLAAADEFGVPMPLMGVVRDSLLQAIAQGGADKDWSVLALAAQERAGLAEV